MRTDLIGRAVVPAAALVCLLAGAPGPLTGGLALAGVALATERLVGLRRSELADRLLVGTGGFLVALVLTGLLLDATGAGLRPTTWAAALIVLAGIGLVVSAVLPARATTERSPDAADRADARRTAVRALPWAGLAVVVTVVAVRMSAASLSAADAEPLQLSFGEISGSSVQVVVNSTDEVGPLELRTSADGNEISYPLFTVARDGSTTTTVALPRSGRFVITLNYPDQTEPLRSLVLDR